jgi:hypothetical protein
VTYQIEFPGFDPATMPAIPPSWSDTSWHNDACPSFLITSALSIYVDYLDPALSDNAESRLTGDFKRFMLIRMEDGQHIDDADNMVAASDDWDEIMAEALADQFAAALKAEIGEDEWAEMRVLNRAHTSDGICASHDYCDANMPMAAAFEAVTGREPMTVEHEGERRFCSDVETPESEAAQERDCGLWNRAWEIAKARYLTEPVSEDA